MNRDSSSHLQTLFALNTYKLQTTFAEGVTSVNLYLRNMKKTLLCTLIFASILSHGQRSEVLIATDASHTGLPPQLYSEITNLNGEVLSSFTTSSSTNPQTIWKLEIDDADLEGTLNLLNSLSSVHYAEINHRIQSFAQRYVPNDLNFDDQWYLDNDGTSMGEPDADVDLPEAWMIERGSEDVTLAIIDGGVRFSHPEFAGRAYENPGEIPNNGLDDDNNGYVDDVNGWDFVFQDNDPDDGNGHGTAVAGIAAANGDDFLGFAGVDWNCKIMSVRVLNNAGGGDYFNLAEALYYVGDMGVDVVNMSLGGLGSSQAVQQAIEYAASRGVLLVAASGNRGDSQPQVPAVYPEVIAVGSINAFNDRSNPFTGASNGGSSYGSHLDVMAPGDQIPILDFENFGNYSDVANGTSLAAPIVSGIACLVKAQHPEYSAAQIKSVIELTCEDQLGRPNEDTPGKDNFYGYGRVNAHAALTADVYVTQSVGNALYIWSDPDNSQIVVRINENATYMLVSDISGRTLYQGEYLTPRTLTIPLPSTGVYFVTCLFNSGAQTEKVLQY